MSLGKAATVPPALVVLSYEPAAATETIALVGKGIVYDTGGLSIKGKTAMPGMKRDCGGAAAILGTFVRIVFGVFVLVTLLPVIQRQKDWFPKMFVERNYVQAHYSDSVCSDIDLT